jgi:rare lipoprotein A (RlpA)-like double-psi beta-barrel protein
VRKPGRDEPLTILSAAHEIPPNPAKRLRESQLAEIGLGKMRRRKFVIVESVFMALSLFAFVPSGSPRTPEPRYFPSAESLAYTTRKPIKIWECSASWYGKDFDGRFTATGEIYDMYAATAAHPSLPLGSIIRVVNTRTHRSQVVRINDRGPYVEGRGLDVSYEVARRLGFDQAGVAKVRVELLEVPSGSTSAHRG